MTVVQKYKPAEMYTYISILHQTPVSNWLNQYKAINKGCSFATRKKKKLFLLKQVRFNQQFLYKTFASVVFFC